MSTMTSNYKLRKDADNDFYSINAINQNLDKIDKGMIDNKNKIDTKSDKSHNHQGLYEPVIDKNTGFNLAKSDNISSSSTTTLATSKAIKVVNDKVNTKASKLELKKVSDKLDENAVVEFETNGASVTSFPVGTKGLFTPIIEGRKPLNNLIDNGNDYTNHVILGIGTTKDANGIHLVQRSGNEKDSIAIPSLQCNQTYTLVYNILKSKITGNFEVEGNSNISAFESRHLPKTVGVHATTITTQNTIATSKLSFKISSASDGQFIDYQIYGLYLGDQTNNFDVVIERPYGVVPSSQNYDFVCRGENKFNKEEKPNKYYPTNSDVQIIPLRTGIRLKTITDGAFRRVAYKVQLKPNEQYTLSRSINKICGASHSSAGQIYITELGTGISTGSRFISFTAPYNGIVTIIFYATHEASESADIEFKDLMLVEGTIAAKDYKTYQRSKTGFSTPKPMTRIGNVYDEIDNDGKLIYRNNEIDIPLEWFQKTTTNNPTGFDMYRAVNLFTSRKLPWGVWGENTARFSINETILEDKGHLWEDLTDTKQWARYSNKDYGYGIDILIPTGKVLKDYYAGTVFKLYYQLVQPIMLRDGEQGYKAHNALNVVEGGDCSVRGTYVKRYEIDNSTTINLSQDVEAIDHVKGEVDGQIQELEYTLTNSTTITLTQAYTGILDIKGDLPLRNYINPNIKGRASASLGDMVVNTANKVSLLNEQLANEEIDNNLILLNHGKDIEVMKEGLETLETGVHKLPVATITGSEIQVIDNLFAYADNKMLRFRLKQTVKGNITLKVNGAIAKQIKNIDDDLIEELEKGVHEVFVDGSFFILRPSGGLSIKGERIEIVEYGEDIKKGDMVRIITPTEIPNVNIPMTNFSPQITQQINAIAWSHDNRLIAFATDTSPYILIYRRNGDMFTKLPNPNVLPSEACTSITFNYNSEFLFLGMGNTLITYRKNQDDSFTKLLNQVLENAVIKILLTSKNRNLIMVYTQNSPDASIWSAGYTFQEDVITLIRFQKIRDRPSENRTIRIRSVVWTQNEDFVVCLFWGADKAISIADRTNNYETYYSYMPSTGIGSAPKSLVSLPNNLIALYDGYPVDSKYVTLWRVQSGGLKYVGINFTNSMGTSSVVAIGDKRDDGDLFAFASKYHIGFYKKTTWGYKRDVDIHLGCSYQIKDFKISPSGEFMCVATGDENPRVVMYKTTNIQQAFRIGITIPQDHKNVTYGITSQTRSSGQIGKVKIIIG